MRTLLPLLFLVGCGEPVTPGGDQPAPKKPVSTAELVEEEEDLPGDGFSYNPAGKRDPFQTFLARRVGPSEIDPNVPPLQRWDVDKYILRGIIWNTNAPRALLIDPEHQGHVVRTGSYVGRNWGKVTSISEECIVVTEEYQTIDGELVVRPVTICFPQEKK
jgi:type IV pilus assembly protein PilP